MKRKYFQVLVNAPSFDIRKNSLVTEAYFPSKSNLSNTSATNETEQESFSEHIDLLKFKRIVLQTLVRRLYKLAGQSSPDFLDEQTYQEISKLYKRAVAKELKEEYKDDSTLQNTLHQEKETALGIATTPEFLGIAVSFLSAAIISLNPIPALGAFNSVLAILAGIIPASIITLNWSLNYRKKRTLDSSSRQDASTYYMNDYDVTNLQAELEQTLDLLDERQYKVVFIIDELDKINAYDLTSVIKSLKLLFNQSKTLFILVVSQEYYLSMVQLGAYRLQEYTLFSQKVFLKRPMFKEMEQFIDNIVETTLSSDPDFENDYSRFRNYVCYASKTDFFDLYNVIRDHIIGYDKHGLPELDIKLRDPRHAVMADLQKVMGQIYARKAYELPSDWYKNDFLLDKMYDLLTKLLENKVGSELSLLKPPRWSVKFESGSVYADDEVQFSAFSDLLYYLEALKFVTLKSSDPEVVVYEINGSFKEKIRKKPIIRTTEESDFVTEYTKLVTLLLIYYNTYTRYNSPQSEEIKDFQTSWSVILQMLQGLGMSVIDSSLLLEWITTYQRLSSIPGVEEVDNNADAEAEAQREQLIRAVQSIRAKQKEFINDFILLTKGIISIRLEESFGAHTEGISLKDLRRTLPGLPMNLQLANPDTFILRGSATPKEVLFLQMSVMGSKKSEIESWLSNYDDLYVIVITTDSKGAKNFAVNVEKPASELLQTNTTNFLNMLGQSALSREGTSGSSSTTRLLEFVIPANQYLFDRLILGLTESVIKQEAPPPQLPPDVSSSVIQNGDKNQPEWPDPFSSDATPFGRPYRDWPAEYWKWILRIPIENNPITDNTGSRFDTVQPFPDTVVFLAHAFGGSVVRTIEIPRGLGIVFPVYTEVATQRDLTPGQSIPDLFKLSRDKMKAVVRGDVRIQGRTFRPYRVQSQLFFVDIAIDNLLGIKEGRTQAVSDGYWVILPPPPPGIYEVHFVWDTEAEQLGSVTYKVTVRETEGW